MRSLLVLLVFVGCSELLSANHIVEKSSSSPTRYDPTWPSLESRPLPSWYDESKVGIFVHWGVYSVPAFGSEWFWTNWRNVKAPAYVQFMENNYRPGFTYQEFAHDFRAELFNASAWTELFAQSGAKYVVLTSKHHDGYALWPSRYSFSWNSVDVGPHRDIVGELATAIRAESDMRFGLYHSLYEWFNPMYLSDKANNFTTNEFVSSKILPEMIELVRLYKPEVIWSDGEWEASSEYWNSTDFLAWLYNDSPVSTTVVSNDRWGHETLCKHGGFFTCSDRFNPGVLQKHKWENAMTIDKLSWGNRGNAQLKDFLTSKELIDEIVVTISCGGNILVNVGPTKFGTIEAIFADRLRDMGRWLKTNGEAIYESQPWIHQNDSYSPSVWYTTRSEYIYAMVQLYPYIDRSVTLHSLSGYISKQTTVTMLGYPKPLEININSDSIRIDFPPKELLDLHALEHVWTIRFDNSQNQRYNKI